MRQRAEEVRGRKEEKKTKERKKRGGRDRGKGKGREDLGGVGGFKEGIG